MFWNPDRVDYRSEVAGTGDADSTGYRADGVLGSL
jgi:hypothetical protein